RGRRPLHGRTRTHCGGRTHNEGEPMRKLIALSVLAALGTGSAAMGQVWAETATGGLNGAIDAGQGLLDANVTNSNSSNPVDQLLTRITGTLVNRDDIDIYAITITDVANFRASTFGPAGMTTSGDTILALFNGAGVAVGWNDNRTESATSTVSTLTN